ncbi:MAG: hypothetical protein KAR20_03280 [Candidatus Heimdallarchaeota archaeon]|nr:hypothetical protein [Candidatus Heimdallarchaeota archaeon]
MEYKRAQVSIEFIMILGALLFFASIFMLVIQGNMEDRMYQRENILVKEIALIVQNEINLALQSGDGYLREFELPQKAGNLNYEINIDSGIVYIKTTNSRHALTLQVADVVGDINITKNTIEKINGVLYLNT